MGDAMNMMKIYSHVQLACAAAPRYPHESELGELRWVHEVKKAPTADEVSGSTVDKLTQVVEKLLDAVEQLSNSFESSGVDPCVLQPGHPFRNEEGYAEYPVEGHTQGRSGTGGTTTNARIGIPLVRVAAVHMDTGN
ncbi:hypothetical protein DPMN_097213 [Dreissena polymorpha]|uniref:Uncharacterized protein n=1 Tax=Dreissena polymorpha TaxID=45954 RepID=A0A9D4LCJ9_DREPO|nr:hypothetical protein DPMN_097213 [Dreissena polymorpha]